jgi:hypothetical protein
MPTTKGIHKPENAMEKIARLAVRDEDVSRAFTNLGSMKRPIQRGSEEPCEQGGEEPML